MRKFLTILALLSAMIFTAEAEVINGTCADTVNVDWSYDTDTKTLSFTLTGMTRLFIPGYSALGQPWKDFIEEIEYLNLPEGLTSIGQYAFNGAISIKEVVLPQSVTALNQYCFMDCHSIHTLNLGPNVVFIGQHALNNCFSLTNLYVPNNVVEIKFEAFNMIPNVEYPADREDKPAAGARSVNGIVEEPMVYDPTDRTRILACSAYAKDYVRVPNGVKNINDYAFFYCFNILTAELPNSVETVGKYAFDDCAAETLIIGSGLLSTGMYAFSMKNLKNVVCKAVTPPDLGMYSFYDTNQPNAVLYVPDESVNVYQTASQWKNFGRILPLSQIPPGIIIGEGIDHVTDDQSSMTNKVLRNGLLFIERNGRTYTTSGQEMK